MEKRRAHFDLATIKATFTSVEALRATRMARNNAAALGLLPQDMVNVVQATERRHFYKSMTAHGDHTVWQDVYHVPYGAHALYVKFTTDDQGHLLLQMKER